VEPEAGVAVAVVPAMPATDRSQVVAVPKRVAAAVPEHVAAAVPEHVAAAVSEHVAVAVSERVAAAMPERVAAVPEGAAARSVEVMARSGRVMAVLEHLERIRAAPTIGRRHIRDQRSHKQGGQGERALESFHGCLLQAAAVTPDAFAYPEDHITGTEFLRNCDLSCPLPQRKLQGGPVRRHRFPSVQYHSPLAW
jgi:hypothetical protein